MEKSERKENKTQLEVPTRNEKYKLNKRQKKAI